jgi:hypothetical protein
LTEETSKPVRAVREMFEKPLQNMITFLIGYILLQTKDLEEEENDPLDLLD